MSTSKTLWRHPYISWSTAQISLPSHMHISGLPHRYSAAQLHFHWGSSSRPAGSEHLVNSKQYAAEVNAGSTKYVSLYLCVKTVKTDNYCPQVMITLWWAFFYLILLICASWVFRHSQFEIGQGFIQLHWFDIWPIEQRKRAPEGRWSSSDYWGRHVYVSFWKSEEKRTLHSIAFVVHLTGL